MADEMVALLARERIHLGLVALPEYSLPEGIVPPRICFLDACSNPQKAFALLRRLSEPPLRMSVVALLGKEHHELALRSLRGGACGCLIQPFDMEQLEPILLRVGYSEPVSDTSRNSRVLCVLPAKGSCGATTLAVSLACQAVRTGYKRVLLADMDPVAGTTGFALRLTSNYSFVDALAHAGQLDPDLWRGLIVPYRGMDVLLSPESPMECDIDPTNLKHVLAYARDSYDLVVLDTGGPFGSLGLELAKLSDQVLLVLTPELASVYASKRAAHHLAAHGVSKAITHLILSRWRTGMGFDRDEIEPAVGLPVLHALPNDPKAIEEALLKAIPISPNTPFGKSVADLAALLLDCGAPTDKATPLGSLRALFSFST